MPCQQSLHQAFSGRLGQLEPGALCRACPNDTEKMLTCAGLVMGVGLLNPKNLCLGFIYRQKDSRMPLTVVSHRNLTSLSLVCMMFSFFQISFLEVEYIFS